MAETEKENVFGRMVAPADGSGEAGKSPWTGIWQVVVPRAADEVIGVETGLVRARQKEQTLPKLLDEFDENGLILRLMARDGDDGLAHLDVNVLAAIVEAQTMGRVNSSEAPERVGTKTDAAVAAPQIDRWIEATEEEAELRSEIPPPWMGLRVSGRMADRRAVELAVDEGRFSVTKLELGFGGGAKIGTLTLASRASAAANRSASSGNREGFTETVYAAQARLTAVLDRPKVAIGWVKALEVGQFLELPIETLTNLRVEAPGGQHIATARLGQVDGQRAVRLILDADENASQPMVAMDLGLGGAPALGGDSLQGLPASDSPGALPDLPGSDFPDLPDLPGGDLPDLPELPGGDLPGLPDLPGGDLPDLPELPGGELPDLPDLPELPDLP